MIPGRGPAILLAAILLPFGGSAHRRTEEGNRHYVEGAYEDALRAYTEAQVDAPQAGELYYDIGNVLYRSRDFAGAAEAYTRALLQGSAALEGPAAFNLGNARFQLEEYGEAVKAYERALRADPGDRDAKRNLELAVRAQERQQQQEPQSQPQSPSEQSDAEQGALQPPPQPGSPAQGEEPADPSGGGERDEAEGARPSGEGEIGEEEREAEPGPARAGQMSPEEAARMLDGLEEQELENLRQQLARQQQSTDATQEEDW